MSYQIHAFTELEQQIHEDLRSQHPEWIEPSGRCPECDEHEARLKKLLEDLARGEAKTEAGQQGFLENGATTISP